MKNLPIQDMVFWKYLKKPGLVDEALGNLVGLTRL